MSLAAMNALKQQEEALTLTAFDESDAFAIGSALQARATAIGASIAIDIRSGSRRYFFSALPGSTPDNEDWARRKGNVEVLSQSFC